ncbi:MAG: ribonucleoside-diphosphate reductase subunit alpha, partial [Cyanobacteria bacterium]|nr:ribonucleoside-diphosphate reductase subunit alpha [Cyanobacteriota bacterium]
EVLDTHQEIKPSTSSSHHVRDAQYFSHYIAFGISEGILDPRLQSFDLNTLSDALDQDADKLFQFQGIQILKDRYLIRNRQQQIIELPQWMWMRVAMGLAMGEAEKEKWAIAFYQLIKDFYYMPSTPTLFSAGTVHPQLSSCFLNMAEDSIEGIFKTYTDNALLSKWAGGIGTDWTPIRGTGSPIRGTNGQSQGLIPWLKIDNDVALAVNQGGKRKGAHCAYLETWHMDIEDFLELRKNVGDERRRAHDINTANWIPDLFMKRVLADEKWTLFSPESVPELHDLFGKAFETAYCQREKEFEAGTLPGKQIQAKNLWRKMLNMIFETGHPWITFKDPCNVRSPQDHVGVVHHSNLCTEITLNTSKEETAVCNLGSINLSRHLRNGQLDEDRLKTSIQIAIRLLDNVIDINYYPTPEAKNANQKHRAIGLGVMGYQEMLYQLNIPFESTLHLEFADRLFELLSYHAISASTHLALERGAYSSFKGSKWHRGIFPVDTLDLLEKERGLSIQCQRHHTETLNLDWDALKEQVRKNGIRNSNLMAIAPTATISNIVGTTPCIEPNFKNLYVTSNLSGEFTVINPWLVKDLEAIGLWNEEMSETLKAVDGKLHKIPGIPTELVQKYPDIFDIDQTWLIQAAAVRGKWLDQSQSLNLFVATPSGKLLHELYLNAWQAGLKTTYYLRTLGASQIEKSTTDQGKFGETHLRSVSGNLPICAIDNPECEACQ